MSPRWATAGVFLVNGAGVGTLLPHLPYLRGELGVSKGVLGLCLLTMLNAANTTVQLSDGLVSVEVKVPAKRSHVIVNRLAEGFATVPTV